MSNRKALVVGINNFKNFPTASLRGCVNDTRDMSHLLQTYLGFTESDITVLTDAAATKNAILAALTSMVDSAVKGQLTYLVFSMSSHGTQVPDLSGDEPDRADEAFCPHDLATLAGGGWDPKHIITDDELNDLFAKLPANVLLEAYLDTCHSGTGLRELDAILEQRQPRYLTPPSVAAAQAVARRRSRGLRHAMAARSTTHAILWAGCRADQTSADANIGGTWHGAFTHYFRQAMDACKNDLSRKQVLAQVRALLSQGHYSQVSQLECNATDRNSCIVV